MAIARASTTLRTARYCALMVMLAFIVTSASATSKTEKTAPPAVAGADSTDAVDRAILNFIISILNKENTVRRENLSRFANTLSLAEPVNDAAAGGVDATPETVVELDAATGSATSPTTTISIPATTTTTTPLPTTTTTSSKVPAPVTTPAPKVAQWAGISVAIVAVVGLILGLVLCKLKSKEQCCFAPKEREVVLVSPSRSNGGLGRKSPSEGSLTSHASGRSFHEATVDESVPRRTLLQFNERDNDENANNDAESPSDDDEVRDTNTIINNANVVTPASNTNTMNNTNNGYYPNARVSIRAPSQNPTAGSDIAGFTPSVSPALPPIGHTAAVTIPRPAAAGITPTPPPRPVSEANSDWSLLGLPGRMER